MVHSDNPTAEGMNGGPVFNNKGGILAAIGINNAIVVYTDGSRDVLSARIRGYTCDNLIYWENANK